MIDNNFSGKKYTPIHSDEVVLNYLKEYEILGLVTIERHCLPYRLSVTVDIPSYFESKGKQRTDANKIKNYFRKNNFFSDGCGEYSRYRNKELEICDPLEYVLRFITK